MTWLRRTWNQPRTVFAVLVPLVVVTFALSGVSGDRTPSDGWLYWIGAVCWAAFGVTFVVTLVYAVAQVVRLLVRRQPAR